MNNYRSVVNNNLFLRNLIANYSGKNMRDQKVWSLPTFERLHIGRRGMKFYKQHCYMYQVTHKVKRIKRLVTSRVKKQPYTY